MAKKESPFDFFAGLFPKKVEDAVAEPEKPKIPDVIIDPDYKLAVVFAAIGAFIILTSPDAASCSPGSVLCPPTTWGVVQGGFYILFASIFAVQAKKIRFVFDETSFELKTVDVGASNLAEEEVITSSGENIVVGGQNRWGYSSFVNYDFFPSLEYPILVYFKETQTPKDKWNEGPGQMDRVGGGQIHFFPAIGNAKQLKEQFEIRGCATVDKK